MGRGERLKILMPFMLEVWVYINLGLLLLIFFKIAEPSGPVAVVTCAITIFAGYITGGRIRKYYEKQK